MKKSQIALRLLVAGLLCVAGGFILEISWMEPQSERQIMEKVLATSVMLGSGVLTLVICCATVAESSTWSSTINLPLGTAGFLSAAAVIGFLLPAPSQLYSPVIAFGLLMALLAVFAITAIYYISYCKSDDDQANNDNEPPEETEREKQMLRWGR